MSASNGLGRGMVQGAGRRFMVESPVRSFGAQMPDGRVGVKFRFKISNLGKTFDLKFFRRLGAMMRDCCVAAVLIHIALRSPADVPHWVTT